MSASRTLAAAAAALALALALPAAPAAGATEPGPERGELLLTVTGGSHTWTRGVRLSCPGPGVRHPHAAEACARLAEAHGRLNALRREDRPCGAEREPVTATADGRWGAADLHWKGTYSGPCALDAATGPVFRF
ncbi:SSI family serine proteinase inhibitor [Streptomyces huiliensis]|uniref:SSI family serine proteinase inhibitor n=1 Tax=Streptomyces huiliensis TaxID=2876027 RepID=UPI001CBAAA86|nr:SSI family serine proteinase inhibitor [Streptomyces huiliensis]MBZ4322846.1 subtilase-type protease inhibitor [Streptomyces huiliensis]